MLYNEFLGNAMQTIKSMMDQSAPKFYCTVKDAVLYQLLILTDNWQHQTFVDACLADHDMRTL
jgi:hypothetical protein